MPVAYRHHHDLTVTRKRRLQSSLPPRSTGARPGGPRRPLPRRAATALVTAFVVLAGAPASGATIAVPDDHPTIAGAMAAARPGDIILVGCGTYREHDIRVRSGVSLWSGTLQPDCVVIDAEGRGRVLIFEDCDGTTAAVGLTLRGGRADGGGGAILCRNSAPRLSRCNIQDSTARRGGGILVTGTKAPVLEDCVFTGNAARLHGGAVAWNSEAPGRLTRCTLEGNTALAGGGVAVLSGAALVFDGGTIADNASGGSGGGVWVGSGAPELRGSLLIGNQGGLGGGAIAVRSGSLRMISCTVADNAAEHAGGGLLVRDGSPVIDRTIVAFNGGAAISVVGAGLPRLTETNLYGHAGGDWVGILSAQSDQDGNFSGDPRFCGRASGRYDLRLGSPCLPGGRPGGSSLVGALDRGCN
jgi:hypothetical protein